MQEALPAGLRVYDSLCNVEAVASLPPQAQTRLVETIQAGLKRLPRAIEQLKINPDTPVGELLNPAQTYTTQTQSFLQGELSQEIRDELADLVQACYPEMPRLSAEALAEAEAMQVVVVGVVQKFGARFASKHLKVDFVSGYPTVLAQNDLSNISTAPYCYSMVHY